MYTPSKRLSKELSKMIKSQDSVIGVNIIPRIYAKKFTN